jgi:hypothetical protein
MPHAQLEQLSARPEAVRQRPGEERLPIAAAGDKRSEPAVLPREVAVEVEPLEVLLHAGPSDRIRNRQRPEFGGDELVTDFAICGRHAAPLSTRAWTSA